jgi:hypothetical protein
MIEIIFAALLATTIAPGPETDAERTERLHEIAVDAAFVAKNDDEAALLLAVAYHESGFALDVDKGPCRKGTCDGGQAACMMQIHATPERRTELFKDRRECFRVGLSALRMSLRACRKNAPEDRFAQYASGSCMKGFKGSRELYRAWARWRDRLAR